LGDTTLLRIDGDTAVLRAADGTESKVPVTAVLVAQGRTADTALASALESRGLQVKVIGDARTGGRIGDAVRDAYEAVTALAAPARTVPGQGQVAC
jgi:hypothetical protein